MVKRRESESDEGPQPRTFRPDWDPIDEAGWESFPASDPPAISGRRPTRRPGSASPTRKDDRSSADG